MALVTVSLTEIQHDQLLRALRDWLSYLWGEQRAVEELNPEKSSDPLFGVFLRQSMHAREIYERVKFSRSFRLSDADMSVVNQAIRRSITFLRGDAADFQAMGPRHMEYCSETIDFNQAVAVDRLSHVVRLEALMQAMVSK